MDEKTLTLLEFPKVLERLAGYTAFAASAELARSLRPTTDIEDARLRLAETSEAVSLLVTHPDLTIGGGARCPRPVDLARHGGVLTPTDLLDIKSTLVAARTLARMFERLEAQFPRLFAIAANLPAFPGLIDAITRAISERGDVLDCGLGEAGSHPPRPAHRQRAADEQDAAHGQRSKKRPLSAGSASSPNATGAMCCRCAPSSRAGSSPSSMTSRRRAPRCLLSRWRWWS